MKTINEVLERIKSYEKNYAQAKIKNDYNDMLEFKTRLTELEWVLNKPVLTYQIIGGTPEAKAEIEATIKKLTPKKTKP